jgi:hypothetical protein
MFKLRYFTFLFQTTRDDPYVNAIWSTSLKPEIHEILHHRNIKSSFEEIYRNAQTMVLRNHGEKLYAGTREVITEYLVGEVSCAASFLVFSRIIFRSLCRLDNALSNRLRHNSWLRSNWHGNIIAKPLE